MYWGQGWQASVPSIYCPAGHPHTVQPVCETLPAAHVVHCVIASPDTEYVPGRQSGQYRKPDPEAYFPPVQLAHVDPEPNPWYVPGAHSVQAEAPPVEYEPPVQVSHTAAPVPVKYRPAWQVAQADAA
jgi:hypothetical protein